MTRTIGQIAAYTLMMTLLWVLMWGALLSWQGLLYTALFGIVVSLLLVLAFSRVYRRDQTELWASNLFRKPWWALWFVGCFLVEVVKANIRVAQEIITPGLSMQPRLIRYGIDDLSDVQATLLANAVTLTPGTLSVDIDPAGRWLYVHCMYAHDREQAVREIDSLRNLLMRGVFE